MLAYTYLEKGKFGLLEKEKPEITDGRDAVVKVTMSSICTSDLHIKHGSVLRAEPGITVEPDWCLDFVRENSTHGGADVVIEAAGTEDTFRMAWECARPNAVVTIVALYDKAQMFPLPDMYGKNLTFKTGGVDGCDCGEILDLISQGKIDTTPLITHRYPLTEIEEAYRIFENRLDDVIKIAVT